MYSALQLLRKLTEKDKYVCIHKIYLHRTEPCARKKTCPVTFITLTLNEARNFVTPSQNSGLAELALSEFCIVAKYVFRTCMHCMFTF
jgi:hypothetical protein